MNIVQGDSDNSSKFSDAGPEVPRAISPSGPQSEPALHEMENFHHFQLVEPGAGDEVPVRATRDGAPDSDSGPGGQLWTHRRYTDGLSTAQAGSRLGR